MQIDPAAARLIKVLSQMAQASQAALNAGALGNEDDTRSAVDTLRRLQAKLNNIDGAVRSVLNALPSEFQAGIQKDLTNIKDAEPFVRNWCQRYRDLLPLETLIQTEEGCQGVLDYALPLDWNFDTDVFILFGTEELVFNQELTKRGQNRILEVAGKPIEVDRENLASGLDARQIKDYFAKLQAPKPARVAMIAESNKTKYHKEWDVIQHELTLSISNSYTAELYGQSWLTQGIINLPNIARSMNMAALKNALNGLPIIIISPGPSLDKNIHLLKALKGRAVLLAAAQCAKALHAAGIVPDFIAIADPNNLVYFLDGVDVSQIEGLIVGVSCHPGFYEKPFKNIITFNANAHIDAWISDIFNDTLPISAAGSISIDCLYFAKYIGCSHIIMVGLDLAISNGQAYSRASANAESKVVIDPATNTLSFANIPKEMEDVFLAKGAASEDTIEQALKLPGYYGGEVITRPNYHLFHTEFVEIARKERLLETPTPLINSTEGGAHIAGFEHIDLIEAINKYIGDNVFEIGMRIQAAQQKTDYAKRQKQFIDAVSKMTKQIQNVLKLVDQCKALSKPGKIQDIKKLTNTEKKLITELRGMLYLSIPNSKQTKMAMEMSGDASNINETNDVANYIYNAIESTSTHILNLLREEERQRSGISPNLGQSK